MLEFFFFFWGVKGRGNELIGSKLVETHTTQVLNSTWVMGKSYLI